MELISAVTRWIVLQKLFVGLRRPRLAGVHSVTRGNCKGRDMVEIDTWHIVTK